MFRGLTYKRLLPLWPLIGPTKDSDVDVRTSRCLGVGNPVYVGKPTVVPFLPPISGHTDRIASHRTVRCGNRIASETSHF